METALLHINLALLVFNKLGFVCPQSFYSCQVGSVSVPKTCLCLDDCKAAVPLMPNSDKLKFGVHNFYILGNLPRKTLQDLVFTLSVSENVAVLFKNCKWYSIENKR